MEVEGEVVPTEEEAAEAAEQQEAGSASGIQWSYFEALDRAQEVVRHRRDFSPGTMEGVEDGTGQGSNHFLKGVKWSPDGLCLLSNCDDNVARLYEVPYDEGATVERTATLAVSPGDTIFDFAWYPRMHSSQPASCCFATTSRGRPVHLWDAFTGKLRASYSGYDDMDELTSALSVTFSASGDQVIAGFNQEVRVWDLARPGRECTSFKTLHKSRQGKRKIVDGQRGLISCVAASPLDEDLFAAGSYSGDTCLYTQESGEMVACLQGQRGGITHIKWAPNGQYIFTGARKDDEILCWDVRNTCQILGKFHRGSDTNQRLYFDVDPLSGRFLATGSQDGRVLFYDLQSAPDATTQHLPLHHELQAHKGACNGVAFHPYFSAQYPLLSTSGGERTFGAHSEEDDESDDGGDSGGNMRRSVKSSSLHDNSIALWTLGGPMEDLGEASAAEIAME